MIRRLSVAAMVLLGAIGAVQAEERGAGFEFGVGFGKATYREDTGLDYVFKDDSTPFKVFGGYRLNRFVALEAAGILNIDGEDTYEGVDLEINARGLQASMVTSLPLGESFELYARMGAVAWQSKVSARFEDEFLSQKNTGTDPMYGVGLGGWLDNALIRLEYERLDVDASDLSMVSLSIAWMFR